MSTRALTRNGGNVPTIFDDFFKPWNEWFELFGEVAKIHQNILLSATKKAMVEDTKEDINKKESQKVIPKKMQLRRINK